MASVFTIPPDWSFTNALASGLMILSEQDPLRLARFTVFLPNRRTCLSLREAFLRASSGRSLLLPRLLPVGSVDEEEALFTATAPDLPPAIPPLRRQLLLTRLILASRNASGTLTPDQAARLAAALARFLDEVQTERLEFDRLATLVPADYADHWQVTLDFLAILAQAWSTVLGAEKCLDPAVRRGRVMERFIAAWQMHTPSGPIVVAGLTHADPVLADLIAAVAALPAGPGKGGYIVLPGLDRTLDEDSWTVLDDTHPQAGLKALLALLGIDRHAVADWPAAPLLDLPPPAYLTHRVRLVREALRPVATTDQWQHLAPLSPQALVGVDRIDCLTPREEALVIALFLREALEHEERTAALVTPDRTLARRVAAELERWGVLVDDSGGVQLSHTLSGVFLRVTVALVAANFAPLPLLETLKHPLAAAGHTPGDFRYLVRQLEIRLLRGPRPAPGIAGLRAALAANNPADAPLYALLAWLEAAVAPLVALMAQEAVALATLVKAHITFAETLATSADQPGADRLWRHDAGVAAADFIANLLETADVFPSLPPRFYPALLDTFMEDRTVRTSYGRHPRLSIWGPLEARLQRPDLLILGGLNEGTWPPIPAADPWMSRPMRTNFGLPPPERRVGLSAHDFMQAFCAPWVVLTRSERIEGTPTVPSRWLLRLDAVMRTAGLHEQAVLWGNTGPWLSWARGLDWPQVFTVPQRPAPRPPLAARPRQLSVTEVETWMRDPYAIYARHVLRLQALPPLDADPSAADYGNLVHKTLERFLRCWPEALPNDPEAELLDAGRTVFAETLVRPRVWAFWWPRFERIARWVTGREYTRRQGNVQIIPEASGILMLARSEEGHEPFFLTTKADRIELLADGRFVLIDYKTGQVPSAKEVAAGYAPQLPLEAAIVMAGGFADVPAGRLAADLLYWRLTGVNEGGEETSAGNDVNALANEALVGVQALIAAFDRSETPYEAHPHPAQAPRYSDYQHLARVKEWATGENEV